MFLRTATVVAGCGLAVLAVTIFSSAGAMELHVSPHGKDTNPGTKRQPLATFEQARDVLRTRSKDEPGTVIVHAGVYRFSESLLLGTEDAGAKQAHVIWKAADTEDVRLTGGLPLTGFQPVTDPAVVKRINPTARSHVLQVDLNAAGVTDLGQVAGKRRAELFFNQRSQPLSRYPNNGWLRIASVPQEGELKFAGDFRNGGPAYLDGQIAGKHYGRFTYSGDRPKGWKPSRDLWVHGYWVYDWSDQYHRVKKLDTTKKEVWPEPPYHFYGYQKNARYYFLNVLEEIDTPGEWYLDRKNGLLYFWPPSAVARAQISFPLLGEPMVLMKNAPFVEWRGFVFEASRGGGVWITGGHHDVIAGCTFRNLGDTAIECKQGTDHKIQSCDLFELGAGGIVIDAGDRKTLSAGNCVVENCHIHDIGRVRPAYHPAIRLDGVGNRVSHCDIHDTPHQGLGYEGNDHVIEYCEFSRTGYDTGDIGAISTAFDWTYRGNVIRYCYFHDIHSPPRTHVGSMTVYLDLPVGGLHLYGNVFHDMQRAFFTNSGRDITIENNLFVDCHPSVQFNTWMRESQFKLGGSWRMVERLADVKYDQPPYSTRYPELLKLFKDGDVRVPRGNIIRSNISFGGQFLELQPLISLNDTKVQNNLIGDSIVFKGSFTGSGKGSSYNSNDPAIAAELGKYGNVVTQNQALVKDAEAEDFTVPADSPAWKLGFKPLPFDQMGLIKDEYRKSLPVHAPVIRPRGQRFLGTINVHLKPSRRGPKAVVRYTLDGSEPTPQSPVYTMPLKLSAPGEVTVKAAAFGPAGRSSVITAGYEGRPLGSQGGVYLSELLATDVFCHAGLKLDGDYRGESIELDGKRYRRGVMLHPEVTQQGGRGRATYRLDAGLRPATKLTAVIGVEDEAREHKIGSVVFIVEVQRNGQWKQAFKSQVIHSGEARPIEVDIHDADQVRLITTDGGDNIYGDLATWADAKLQ